jgi:hypothetical protein
MLIKEAKWFSKRILGIDPSNLFPMLNVGSSSSYTRKISQPWIDKYIFEPIRRKHQSVLHLDMLGAPGVDIVGDLSDSHFLEKLSKINVKSVLCTNLLEHISNIAEVCKILTFLIPVNGYIFVSTPYKYPYHADPIDNLFRPTVQELSSLFPHTRLIHGETVLCGTELDYLSIRRFFANNKRIPSSYTVSNKKKWTEIPKTIIKRIPWLFKHFQATCLVLQKCSGTTH